MRVAGLFIYPIKGCRGVAVPSLDLSDSGILGDRRFMLVDESDAFLSQRNCAVLARYVPRLVGRVLEVSAPDGAGELQIQMPESGESLDYAVWSRSQPGIEVREGSEWFTERLQKNVRFLYCPTNTGVAFHDAAQVLVTSQASLDDLNQRLTAPISMSRFRANIVLEGVDAYAEDEWGGIALGQCDLATQERCGRCVVTTIDQETGKKTGTDPLRTLVKYRLFGSEACFGMYYSVQKAGRIHVGDPFEVRSPLSEQG